MTDVGTCDQCDASMRPDLISSEPFVEAMKDLKRKFPAMQVRLRARPVERLLCAECRAAGHSTARQTEDGAVEGVLEPAEEEWQAAGDFLED